MGYDMEMDDFHDEEEFNKKELERLKNEVEGGGVSVNITTDDPPEETE